MTYIVDVLLGAWDREQASDELQVLPVGIANAIACLVNELCSELPLQLASSLQAAVIKKELDMLGYAWADMLAVRRRKIDEILERGDVPPGPSLLPVEREYINAMKTALAVHAGSKLVTPMVAGLPARDQPSGTTLVIRFIDDAGEIVGIDMRTHGPFKKEDIACIPRENAVIFVDRGKAREVAT